MGHRLNAVLGPLAPGGEVAVEGGVDGVGGPEAVDRGAVVAEAADHVAAGPELWVRGLASYRVHRHEAVVRKGDAEGADQGAGVRLLADGADHGIGLDRVLAARDR